MNYSPKMLDKPGSAHFMKQSVNSDQTGSQQSLNFVDESIKQAVIHTKENQTNEKSKFAPGSPQQKYTFVAPKYDPIENLRQSPMDNNKP